MPGSGSGSGLVADAGVAMLEVGVAALLAQPVFGICQRMQGAALVHY